MIFTNLKLYLIEYTGINMIVLDEDRSDKEYIEKQVVPTLLAT